LNFCFRSVTQLIWFADWEATDDFHPDNTDSAVDYEKNQFLDLRKPLFMQMWRAKFRYVHLPREPPVLIFVQQVVLS